ncbi:MAG TPA: efflux RND transporter periplasmic adaptor subunit [Arenibacter sp.]|nr:efflux RND transporter periplasmic adaptor subunit [Arenibacter sp.]
MKHPIFIALLLLLFASCASEEKKAPKPNTSPLVSGDGLKISFPDLRNLSFFRTEKVANGTLTAEFSAPAHLAATLVPSRSGADQPIILFDNPELAGHYSQLMQHQINIDHIQKIGIKQKQLELERTRDLNAHGAATGQDVLNAEVSLSMEQSLLANEKTALTQYESKLIAAGLTPGTLRKSSVGTAYLIAEIPETQVGKIEIGSTCSIGFHSFPDKSFTGKIDALADIVDPATRMVKVRIEIKEPSQKLKAGMFANVSFDTRKDDRISIHKNALITIQGKHYVFVKISEDAFKRNEIQIGQQIGDRIIVFNGLSDKEEIAIEGVMQLKGLSFGY